MLRIGTCSWKYPSWKGLVYSRATGIDYLSEYATRYNTVEVDQWFWALPEPTTAASKKAVPRNSAATRVRKGNFIVGRSLSPNVVDFFFQCFSRAGGHIF